MSNIADDDGRRVEFVPVDGQYDAKWWAPWLELWMTTFSGPEVLPWNVHRQERLRREAAEIQAGALDEIQALTRSRFTFPQVIDLVKIGRPTPARSLGQWDHYTGLDGRQREKWWLTGSRPGRPALPPAPIEPSAIIDPADWHDERGSDAHR